MDAVFPATASALARGRRVRRAVPRARRTLPVTFAEIKEVDEENAEVSGGGGGGGGGAGGERRRRPDVLCERGGRRARAVPALRELSPPRAASEPADP